MQVTENRGTGIKPDTRNAIWENARRREAASDEQKIVNKAALRQIRRLRRRGIEKEGLVSGKGN